MRSVRKAPLASRAVIAAPPVRSSKKMPVYGAESGVAVVAARIRDFRSLANIEVELSDLTVLIGANNAGKTSFLDALFAAIGAGRKALGADDVRLAPGES